jgi:glycerol-3-phosphate dehydrogenase subunit C
MREGSLDAPTRHPVAWQDPDFYDEAKLDAELRRVFDICHGCRRCFNLCDSFPTLFDLIDESPTGELDGVKNADFQPVVGACTLCDMCFMTKCPYVPPHEFNLDFPHLMLRARAVEHRKGKTGFAEKQVAETDRNGRLGCHLSGLANWATDEGNKPVRKIVEAAAGIHREAALPPFAAKTLERAGRDASPLNGSAPAFGRKAVLYATCYGNYNKPSIGLALRAVLAHNGVETAIAYPGCCGMPQLEQGDVARVAEGAKRIAADLGAWIAKGYDVIALVPSCALMLKFEWPLLVPEDAAVKALAEAIYDASEYIVDIAEKEGLAPGLKALPGGVTLHIACHARAQNVGRKAEEMLKLVPGADLTVIERCSGHGGSWGVRKEHFETAIKVGRPVARQAKEAKKAFLASECPLAASHIRQGMERASTEGSVPPLDATLHPVELFAKAYGLAP